MSATGLPPPWASALWSWLARLEACIAEFSVQRDDLRYLLNIELAQSLTHIAREETPANFNVRHDTLRMAVDQLISEIDDFLFAGEIERSPIRERRRRVTKLSIAQSIPHDIRGLCLEVKAGLSELRDAEVSLYDAFRRSDEARIDSLNQKRRFGAFASVSTRPVRSPFEEWFPTVDGHLMLESGRRTAQLADQISTRIRAIWPSPVDAGLLASEPKTAGRREHTWKPEILTELRRRISEDYKLPELRSVLAQDLVKWARERSLVQLRQNEGPPAIATVENWIRPLLQASKRRNRPRSKNRDRAPRTNRRDKPAD